MCIISICEGLGVLYSMCFSLLLLILFFVHNKVVVPCFSAGFPRLLLWLWPFGSKWAEWVDLMEWSGVIYLNFFFLFRKKEEWASNWCSVLNATMLANEWVTATKGFLYQVFRYRAPSRLYILFWQGYRSCQYRWWWWQRRGKRMIPFLLYSTSQQKII